MDNPPEAEVLGSDHRILRHAYNKAEANMIRTKWGEKAIVEWLFHIALDNIHTAFKFSREIYGEDTYNFMKIGITTNDFIKLEFDRKTNRELNIEINENRKWF